MVKTGWQLRLVARGRGRWHFSNQHFSGDLQKFKFIYAGDEYMVLVRQDDETLQTDVALQGCTTVEPLIMQLEGSRSVFRVSPLLEPVMLYHPLGLPEVDGNGRLRRRRVRYAELSSVEPKESRDFLAGRVKVHEEVAYRSPPSLAGKLCVVLPAGDPTLIVEAFIYERLLPTIALSRERK